MGVVKKRVHCLGKKFHNWKLVHLGKGMEVAYIEVVPESNCVGMVKFQCMVHMACKVVGMVDKD